MADTSVQQEEGGGREGAELLVKRHTQYFKRTLGILPSAVESLDTSR